MTKSNDSPQQHYERQDVSVRAVAWVAGATAAGIGLSLLIAWWAMGFAEPVPDARLPLLDAASPTPQPRLQVAPAEDLEAFMARKLQHLNSYGWVDRKAGIAHIPIDRSIERLVEKGVPRWAPADGADAATTAHRARQAALSEQEQAP